MSAHVESARAESGAASQGVTKSDLRELIRKLGQRTIAFVPAYAHLPGLNVNSALLLSQMIFWTDKGELEDSWVYKSRGDWVEETHLTWREVDTARLALRKSGILEETLRGLPARLHWKLNLDRLAELLCKDARKPKLETKVCVFRKARVTGNAKLSSGKRRTGSAENAELSFYAEMTPEMTDKRERQSPSSASRKARTCKTPLPDDFQPSEENKTLASQLKLDLGTEMRKFFAHHRAKGTEYADWTSALSLWLERGNAYNNKSRAAAGRRENHSRGTGAIHNSRDDIEQYKQGADLVIE